MADSYRKKTKRNKFCWTEALKFPSMTPDLISGPFLDCHVLIRMVFSTSNKLSALPSLTYSEI